MYSSLILAAMLTAGNAQGQTPATPNSYPYAHAYVYQDYQRSPAGCSGVATGAPSQGPTFTNPFTVNDTGAYGGYGTYGTYGAQGNGYGSYGGYGGCGYATPGSYSNYGGYAGYGSYSTCGNGTRPVPVPAPVPAPQAPPVPHSAFQR